MTMASQREFLMVLSLATTLFCVVVGDSEIQDTCPPSKDIYPCTCKPDYDGSCFIMCYAVSLDEVERVAEIPNLCGGYVEFTLIHSKIKGIPKKLWQLLLSSPSVDVSIKYSNVEYLVLPKDGPLPDLYSPKDASIKIEHSQDIGKWQWEQLKNFSSAEGLTIVVDDTPMTVLPKSFSEISKGFVKKIILDSTGLTSLPDAIFKSFTMMYSLSIQNNYLTEIKRNSLPQPAPELKFLALNGNSITSLPGDLFADMPSLEIVYLRENQLTTLPSDIFTSVNSQSLHLIDLVKNPWNCDCNLIWTAQNSTLHKIMGKCASPTTVRDQKVESARGVLHC